MIRHGTMTCTMSDQPASTTSPPRPVPRRRRDGCDLVDQFLGWPRALRITAYVAVGVVLAPGGRRS